MVRQLVAMDGGTLWTAHPLESWRHEELIGKVLDLEFPNWCRFHGTVKPCATCAG